MMHETDIRDDEIRIIGCDTTPIEPTIEPPKPNRRGLWFTLGVVAAIVVAVVVWIFASRETTPEEEPALFEPLPTVSYEAPQRVRFGTPTDSLKAGHCEIRDTTINDIPLRIYIPHNASLELHVGRIDKADTTIIYTAQAADVRADNGKIVGAFVLRGEPKAWGLSKRGFCASIDGKVTVGVADNSPLFEEATERGGYFFRQYPLVQHGVLVENNPKNKSYRRAICDRLGEIFMVETLTQESFHDFSQALVDLGIDEAVSLVGSTAYGWAVDENGERHEFGDENIYRSRRYRMPRNISYIVWRKKR